MPTTPTPILPRLALSDALAKNLGHELLAAEWRADTGPARRAEHSFDVSSLDRLETVQVLFSQVPRDVTLTLQAPGRPERYTLERIGAAHWAWHRPADEQTGPGRWKLTLTTDSRVPPWVFQAWATSPLKLTLSLRQRHATGKTLRGAVALTGASTTELACRGLLRPPPGDRLDALIVQQYASSAALRQQLATQVKAHWPAQLDRPWWRLMREHKLAALRSANIALPDGTPPSNLVEVQCERGEGDSFSLLAPGLATRSAGTHTLVARVTGRIAGSNERFERLVYRQVFAEPQPDPKYTNTRVTRRHVQGRSIHTVEVTLWDRYRNPVLVAPDDPIVLKGLDARSLPRTDGSLAWEIEAPGSKLPIELTRRGERFLTGIEVPLLRNESRPFDAFVSHGRISRELLRDALDPRVHERVLDLRAREHALLRPPAGSSPQSVSLFVSGRAIGYRVEVVRESGDVELVGEGSGARRFALPETLGPNDHVRVTPIDDTDDELEIAGVQFD